MARMYEITITFLFVFNISLQKISIFKMEIRDFHQCLNRLL